MRPIIAIAGLCMLAGCASTAATVNSTLATAQADASKAVTFYQTAKGIALVAELAQPSLAPAINKAITVLDPLVATAQATLSAATADAPTLEALAQQITTQAVALTQTAAPAVKVVSGS